MARTIYPECSVLARDVIRPVAFRRLSCFSSCLREDREYKARIKCYYFSEVMMRSRKALVLALLLLSAASPGFAQHEGGSFGFGFILGEPTGLSWKYTLSRTNALDGVIGVSPGNRFRIHVDYLWNAFPFHDPGFSLHYGIGAVVGFGETWFVEHDRKKEYWASTKELGVGLRVPFGIDYAIPRSPVELFFELAPIFIFAPDIGAGIDIGLGVRFYP